MAAITLKALGTALAANAAAVGSAASVTTAQITALANMLVVMDDKKGESLPIRYLNATDLANLTSTT